MEIEEMGNEMFEMHELYRDYETYEACRLEMLIQSKIYPLFCKGTLTDDTYRAAINEIKLTESITCDCHN